MINTKPYARDIIQRRPYQSDSGFNAARKAGLHLPDARRSTGHARREDVECAAGGRIALTAAPHQLHTRKPQQRRAVFGAEH